MTLLFALALGVLQGDSVHIRHVAGSVYVVGGAVDQIGVSAGPDGVLMVDAGYMETLDGVRAAVASLGRGAPRYLINTHWHHTFANTGFREATVIAHRRVADRMRKTNLMFNRAVPPAPTNGLPDTAFEDTLTLRFNGEDVRVVHFPRAHTDGDAVVIFPRSNVVLTGDVFVPHFPWIDYAAGGHLDGLLRALDRLVELVPNGATIIPGHGPVSDYRKLTEFRSMVRMAVELVRARMAEGASLQQIQARGVPAEWREWEGDVPVNLFLESIYKGLNRDGLGRACEFVNGQWFDGEAFIAGGGYYVVDGVLTQSRPAVVECAIDLGDRYVLPPFADAHTHRLGAADRLDADTRDFLSAGVFYAMVQDPMHAVGPELRARGEAANGVEAIYTHGVVTSSWSVIADFYALMAAQGAYGPGVTMRDLQDEVVFFIDDAAALGAKWLALAARNKRFIKVVLAFSEEFSQRRSDPRYDARPSQYSKKPGIDPQLLPAIIDRAHRAGLEVSVHIETAHDFRVAVRAGADYIAHLPGSWQIGALTGFPEGDLSPWLLTQADAALARERGVIVITTTLRSPGDPNAEAFRRVHRHNLDLLRREHVQIALGSDSFDRTVVDELLHLAALGVFSPQELLHLATVATPSVLFPGRKFAHFAEGYEASFLVLDRDPIQDLNAARSPSLRVKRGVILRQ